MLPCVGLVVALNQAGWAQGKTWALVVGIDEYVRPSIPKLRYAVADAKLFAQALKETMKVPAENLFLMTSDSVDENSQPRVVNVAYRLGWLSEKASKDDTIIFFFAGHGMTVEGQPFLLTEEADNRSSSTLKVSALNGGEVIGTLRKPAIANVWVVLDACRNSPNGPSEARLDSTISGSFSHSDVGRERTATMFACKVGERSWEWDEVKHGCYTYFLVDGLRRQAADASGRVTLQSLSNYVNQEVPKATKKLGASQTPTLFYGGLGPDQWLLANVQAPAQASQTQSGPADTAKWVAQLEILQAKLDRETALRVAAEQRARSEESRRLELEQRLALLEKQVSGAGGLSGPKSEPKLMAYAQPDQQDGARGLALIEEVKRLQEENRSLSQRLSDLQSNLAKVGMVSRDVQLTQELEQEQAQETALQSTRAVDPPAQLELCLQIREAQGRQLQLLEGAYAKDLNQRPLPAPVATEVAFLREQIEIQKQDRLTSAAHMAAAQSAIQEAQNRLHEATAREQKYQSIILKLTADLKEAETRLARSQLDLMKSQGELEEKNRKLREAEDRLEEMAKRQEQTYKGTALAKNPFRITRRAQFSDLVDILKTPPSADKF
jgi:uncharacterized caspase-like protein